MEINENELYTLLSNSKSIENRIINLNEIKLDLYFNINFINCSFIANETIFIDLWETQNKKNISFIKCDFKSLTFEDCFNFGKFHFESINSISNFRINNCKIETFYFANCLELNCNISINSSNILKKFNFENNHFKNKASFRILKSDFNEEVIFENNTFNILAIALTNFKDFAYFSSNNFNVNSKAEFFICEFQQVNFSNFEVESNTYTDCKFHGISQFTDINYTIKNTFNFENCYFEKATFFNDSSFYKLNLNNIKFKELTAFQQTYFDIISIERTIFEEGALFDDIQIKKIDDCDRRTIRTIKQELQKADNKIDFSRFRVYEFNAYRKDIVIKLKNFENDKNRFYHRKREPVQLKRDLFILKISDLVSEYGTDWKRALKFTMLSGLLIYLIFFSIENYNLTLELKRWGNWEQFISGLFRFFLVTDFYNPLENDRVYLTNPFSWVIFIFGKIVIAFGIYEMIQSFRKFKA